MKLFQIFVLFLVSFFFASSAQAAVVAGQNCTQFGTSQITDDGKNIAVCLKDDSGNLIWKSMTASTLPSMAPCGTIPHGNITQLVRHSYSSWQGMLWTYYIVQCQNGTLQVIGTQEK